jgi:hypothetical protein
MPSEAFLAFPKSGLCQLALGDVRGGGNHDNFTLVSINSTDINIVLSVPDECEN